MRSSPGLKPASSVPRRAIAVIPARYGSRRFPGKPLIEISGVPMVLRVARQAAAARTIERVVVATDDQRIYDVVDKAGVEVVMTPGSCASGTDRVAAALAQLEFTDSSDCVVNVQGDEPLVDPADLDALVEAVDPTRPGMGTLARPIESAAAFHNPNIVKVVVAPDGRALYFSRAPIPAGASVAASSEAIAFRPLQHVGLYAYAPQILKRLTCLSPSPLEKSERLEQLRALEHEIPIYVTMCVSRSHSIAVDVPEDVARVECALNPQDISQDAIGGLLNDHELLPGVCHASS